MQIRKYFTKSLLIEYNNAAIRENRNQQLKEEYLESLDENGIYIIVYNMHHNTINEMRVRIMFDLDMFGLLDMSYERFKLLPTITFNDDGTVIVQPEDDVRKNFPYNGREWVEKTIRSPYRHQDKFRKEVLKAYGNRCAVCDVSEPKILRAAHIVDVSKGGNDSVENGICLCVNHEVAYDNGILKISPDGDITVSSSSIKIDKEKINFPSDKNLYPSKKYLKQKYESFNIKK